MHGGPQGAWNDAWTYRWNAEVFASAGYVVVAPNPRGSTGFGQRFTDEISRDWGGKVFEDLMKGVDAAEKLPYVDATRKVAAGASYGGYAMNWFLGHTDRFKALVSHAGVFNLTSMYGVTEELWFPEWDLGGTPWDNRAAYEKWSPHMYAKNFKTPTLVTHGELDYRVPVGEGFQLFTTLQRQGVPSRLLVFPGRRALDQQAAEQRALVPHVPRLDGTVEQVVGGARGWGRGGTVHVPRPTSRAPISPRAPARRTPGREGPSTGPARTSPACGLRGSCSCGRRR